MAIVEFSAQAEVPPKGFMQLLAEALLAPNMGIPLVITEYLDEVAKKRGTPPYVHRVEFRISALYTHNAGPPYAIGQVTINGVPHMARLEQQHDTMVLSAYAQHPTQHRPS